MDEQTIPVQSGHPKHEPKTECRAWVRFASNQATMASPTADSAVTAWLGQVRDISRGGVALILPRWIERGTHLIVDLATNAAELRRLPVQVVHASWEMDCRWIIGCAFATPLSDEELQDLLKE